MNSTQDHGGRSAAEEIEFLEHKLAIANTQGQQRASAHVAALAETRQVRATLSETRNALRRLVEDAEELARFIEASSCFDDDDFPVKAVTRREGQVRVDNLRLAINAARETGQA